VVADVPYTFQYGDDVHANRSVLFDLDKVMATTVVRRLDHVNWFNRNYGVCVLELILYTPYSDLLTQVSAPSLLPAYHYIVFTRTQLAHLRPIAERTCFSAAIRPRRPYRTRVYDQ